MKNKKKFAIIGVIILFGLIFNIIPIKGITRDMTVSTVAEKDSYVESNKPTSNVGGNDWLIFGNYNGWNEAYLYFNFSDKPAGWTKAEISLYMYYVSTTFYVTVSLIDDTWDEYTINWNNKPKHREIITTFTVSERYTYKIDITDYIAGRDDISICLNASDDSQNGYGKAYSRERYYYSPQLIWTYPETAEINVTSPESSDYWEDFNTYTIKWSSNGSISRVRIELYKGSSFIEDITYIHTDNDGEFDFYVWSTEDYFGTNYRVKITDYDDYNVYDYSDYFSINCAVISVTNPTSLSVLRVGEKHTIKWTSIGPLDKITIELYKGSILIETIASSTENDGEYDWTVGLYQTGSDYSICIRGDYYDTDVNACTAEFTIENPIILIIIIVAIIVNASIGIGVFLIIFIKKRRKREISPEPISTKPVKEKIPQKLETIPTNCPNCGAKVTKEDKFCMNCGHEF